MFYNMFLKMFFLDRFSAYSGFSLDRISICPGSFTHNKEKVCAKWSQHMCIPSNLVKYLFLCRRFWPYAEQLQCVNSKCLYCIRTIFDVDLFVEA